jgi:hypothetical protein
MAEEGGLGGGAPIARLFVQIGIDASQYYSGANQLRTDVRTLAQDLADAGGGGCCF